MGSCHEISTPSVSGTAADTEILVKNSNGVWVRLSDDPPFTGTYAHAFIYFFAGNNTRSNPKIRVTAYNDFHHDEAFVMENSFLTEDFNGCMDGVAGLDGTIQQASAFIDGNNVATLHRVL
ncbi:MAG TPA: hypothetical protein VJ385_06235 [Fibrobacteria bacterium]|nr:hypothetical protein [Fibrobacteria bacterium]